MSDSFTVFIIDDDKMMLILLKDFVQSKYGDATVDVFATGEEALMELHRKPNVILLDYHLDSKQQNAMNGLEILKRIKQLLPHVPVIFLSAQDDPGISADVIKYGGYDYIVKGEDAFHRLEVMINNATGHLSLRKAVKTQKIFNVILIILFVIILVAFIFQKMM